MQPEQPIQPSYSPPTQSVGTSFSRKQRLLMYGVGIFAGFSILLIVGTFVFGGKQSPNQVALNTVYSRNVQILNLLDTYGGDLRTAEGISDVSRSTILITSDNLSLSEYASSLGEKQIAEFGFEAIMTELEKAIPQSDFDEYFIATVNYEIASNKALLEGLDPSDVASSLEPIISTAISNYDSLLN